MRKFISATLVAALSAAVFAAMAVAQPDPLTVTTSPNPAVIGQERTTTVTGAGSGDTLILSVYADSDCTQLLNTLDPATADDTGMWTSTVTVTGPPAVFYLQVRDVQHETVSNCWRFVKIAATATAVAPPPNIFLCYSAYQDQPGVWPQDVAEQLLKQGYWLPYAVSGDSTGGTNLGGFHLSCNPASTQSVSDSFVGGDGTELGPQYAGTTTGLYPKIGG